MGHQSHVSPPLRGATWLYSADSWVGECTLCVSRHHAASYCDIKFRPPALTVSCCRCAVHLLEAEPVQCSFVSCIPPGEGPCAAWLCLNCYTSAQHDTLICCMLSTFKFVVDFSHYTTDSLYPRLGTESPSSHNS